MARTEVPNRIAREENIFQAAAQLSQPTDRQAFLDLACKDDPVLRARIEKLLAMSQDTFFETPLVRSTGSGAPANPAPAPSPETPSGQGSEAPGDRVGRYKLLQRVGEGGCGVVYMAEQSEPVRRRVALKVIKVGMDTKQVIARFEAERQALALMDHPNIAKVLDAGATATGRPFFVMELVRGVRITEFCDEHKLSTAQRLELFIQVCQAIEHAHRKGIIHRDIKPSNILVTINDGVPVPKIIDFGIAKATTGQMLTDKTLFTAYEQFLGTPAYMSPEQTVLTSLEIDPRSDIYSLGVLLYELLTSKTPFDPKALLQAGFDEMRRTIREQEPVRPSTCLSTMLEVDLNTTAKLRQAEAPKLISLLRGDLDWVVMKALEKERARRYGTANGLALDVRQYLEHKPVLARPPSAVYRFQKLVRRNRLQVAAGGIVAAVLGVALAITSRQAARARRAEQAAEKQAEIARSAQDFISEQLPHLYRVRLGEESPGPLPASPAKTPPSIWRCLINNDWSIAEVPPPVVRTYLALNRTNAESLLAAARAVNDPPDASRQLIRQAATSFPAQPEVLFAAVTLDLFPEDRRSWIDRYKQTAPEDALPLYLSARAHLKEGDLDHATEDLQAAIQKKSLNDYFAERAQASEEIYLQAGRSPAEAKAVGLAGTILPHLAPLKDLGMDLATLASQYIAQGDPAAAENAVRFGVTLGRQLGSGAGADTLVSQKVGFTIERTVLDALPPDSSYAWLGRTPAQRKQEIDSELAGLDQARQREDAWLCQAPESEIIAFFDRLKLYGESAACRWFEQRAIRRVTPP